MGVDELRRLARFLELLTEATRETQVRVDRFDVLIPDADLALTIRFDPAPCEYRVDDRRS
jgi:hypothetical protein